MLRRIRRSDPDCLLDLADRRVVGDPNRFEDADANRVGDRAEQVSLELLQRPLSHNPQSTLPN